MLVSRMPGQGPTEKSSRRAFALEDNLGRKSSSGCDGKSMTTYYNEFDKNAAAWIINLGEAGEIEKGVVDERSIKEVSGADLAGRTRAHFFAGIGGWDLALRIAGWGENEVWTGSCPCQPFSSAGKGLGEADARDLWPDFFRLIRECRPRTIFGEQVASAAVVGKVGKRAAPPLDPVWLDRVFADLEGEGYACGSAVLGAHSVGANHIRQRLYWGATLGRMAEDADGVGRGRGRHGDTSRHDGEVQATGLRAVGGVGHGHGLEVDAIGRPPKQGWHSLEWYEQALSEWKARNSGVERSGEAREFQHDNKRRFEGARILGASKNRENKSDASGPCRSLRFSNNNNKGLEIGRSGWPESDGRTVSPWSSSEIVLCSDERARRVMPGVFPLAHAWPKGKDLGESGSRLRRMVRNASRSRIGILKGSGNAIVPALAAEFIMAFREVAGI